LRVRAAAVKGDTGVIFGYDCFRGARQGSQNEVV
jgi:hypothetical protein